jgi:UDP-2,3-diacylglucosamine pyrophosphatase LpxH
MLDALILSDLHLGSDNCQAQRVVQLLEWIREGVIRTARLILNGDVFDSFDFRRLDKTHWQVLALLRQLSAQIDIIWLTGNHDGSVEAVSHLLGVRVRDDYVLESGPQRILVLHGHVCDDFLDRHPWLTWIADRVYGLLQRLDRTHYLAKLAKHGSKTFLRCENKVEDRAVAMAREKQCTAVCCGHTHVAAARDDQPVAYYNSGCWTELPGSYLTLAGGTIQLHEFGLDAPFAEAARLSMLVYGKVLEMPR